MRLIIKATNTKLTPALREYVLKSIGELGKFLEPVHKKGEGFPHLGRDPIEARVEIGKTTKHHRTGPFFRAEATIFLPQSTLRAEAEREDLRYAITEIKDELHRGLKHYRQKVIAKQRRAARLAKRRRRLSKAAQFKEAGRTRQEGL